MRETITFAPLTEWERAEVGRHFAQTYGLNYGGLERQEALVFRLPAGDPAVVRTEPAAVLLRELTAAARSGGTVKPPRLGKPDATRVSELLRQSAERAAREARDDAVTITMARMVRDWDDMHRVPADEYERAEHLRFI